MKKLIYLSTAMLLLAFAGTVKAEPNVDDLTPSEIFCPLTSSSDMQNNADDEIHDQIRSNSNELSFEEKKVLDKMDDNVDDKDTVLMVCSPQEI